MIETVSCCVLPCAFCPCTYLLIFCLNMFSDGIVMFWHVFFAALHLSLPRSHSLFLALTATVFLSAIFLSQLARRFLFLQLFTHFAFISLFFCFYFKCKAVEFNLILWLFVLYLDLWAQMYLHVASKSTLLRQQRSVWQCEYRSQSGIFKEIFFLRFFLAHFSCFTVHFDWLCTLTFIWT